MKKEYKQYFELIKEWNQRINLTAIDSEDGFLKKHVEDSLSLLPYISNSRNVLDLGTGAGIPGIILKIERPDLKIVLVDSTRKKISFCSEVIRRLNLQDIEAVWGRAEDVGLIKKLGEFDLVVSRATWVFSKFLEMAEPYVAGGRRAIAMKGPHWPDELEAAGELIDKSRFSLEGTHLYKLLSGEERCLICCVKS